MQLSIVIPSHYRADLLQLCLRSVTRFAPPRTEIVVVDDGSANHIVSRTAERFPGVRIVRRAKAGGFCVSANAGIAAATAPIVQLLNDDTEVTEGWANAVRLFADGRVAAVAPLVLQNDPLRLARGLPPRIDSAGDEYDAGGFARKRRHGEICQLFIDGQTSNNSCSRFSPRQGRRTVVTGGASSPVAWSIPGLVPRQGHRNPRHSAGSGVPPGRMEWTTSPTGSAVLHPWLHPTAPPGRRQKQGGFQFMTINSLPIEVWGASATAAFYRRDALLQVGGFPEHFGAYFEDVDLSFRLRQAGFSVIHDPASVVWHLVSSSYGKRPTRRTLEQQSCNEERVFWRNIRGRQRLKFLPRHAAVLAGKALRRIAEGTFIPWFLGRVRVIAG